MANDFIMSDPILFPFSSIQCLLICCKKNDLDFYPNPATTQTFSFYKYIGTKSGNKIKVVIDNRVYWQVCLGDILKCLWWLSYDTEFLMRQFKEIFPLHI